MDAPLIKGAGLRSHKRFLEDALGARRLKDVMATVSEGTRQAHELILPSVWYPVTTIDETWAAVSTVIYADDQAAFREFMWRLGEFVARDNLRTIYRAVLRLVGTPNALFKALPRMWQRYFCHVDVELVPASGDMRGGACIVGNLESVRHIDLAACGWIEFAFREIRASSFQIEELTRCAGPIQPELRFEMTWDGP